MGWVEGLAYLLNFLNLNRPKNNKVLLYNRGNYIQHPVTNPNGKEYEKNIYTCITESVCCTAEINTLINTVNKLTVFSKILKLKCSIVDLKNALTPSSQSSLCASHSLLPSSLD